jgi:hypothetical protein
MIYPFDEQKERDVLMNQVGQLGTPKPGITRAVSVEFFYRRDTYLQAKRYMCPLHAPYGLAEYVTNLISIGFDQPIFKPFGVVELHKKDFAPFYAFSSKKHKIAYQYTKMLFTEPSCWGLIES